jgi:hypothetical protein
VAALAIALVTAVIVGLGPSHSSKPNVRRTLVSAYILRVGRIQLGMAAQVRAVDKEYKQFAHDPAGIGKHVQQYRHAERTLAALRDRLSAVEPPREARRLHTLLLELADANVSVAASVTALATYLPQLSREQATLGPAVATLRAEVRKAHTAKTQSAAFATYAATVGAAAGRVARLHPPSFFARARKAEVTQLRHLSSLATEISDALAHNRLAAAQQLVAELGRAEGDTSVAEAQRAGALAYNARLQRIRAISTQLEKERKRLEKRVPA